VQANLHAEAQLRRQLQHIATHFPLQQQKYANKHTADALRRNISFGFLNRAFASSECSLKGDIPAENKALHSQAVNEWVVCSNPDRGAALFLRTPPLWRALRIDLIDED
jgi:hypothetical protein